MATTLSDVILAHIKNEVGEIYTTLPATITDVSKLASDNVVTVQPALDYVDTDGEVYEYPPLSELRVHWPSGGGAIMTFPLAVGDDVLVVFSMRSISEFQASTEGTVQPFDNRFHNLSDGYVMPSIYRDANQPSPNADDLEIRYGDGEITVMKDGTIDIFNANGSYKINADGTHQGVTSSTFSMSNGSVELVDILSQTLTEISNSLVNTMLGAQPLINKAAIQALIAQLDQLKE